MFRCLLLIGCLLSSGCSLLPDIAWRPAVHNPFPQLSKVAVAPFFNLSNESTADGRSLAMAYFAELQSVPGFEVVPVNVTERAIQDNSIRLDGPADARRLAQILDVDAVVLGAVTDYSPYYPPRLGLQVEWYAANPCFHPIPPGYAMPWGTPDEDRLPAATVFEAELALAKAQLETQTPVPQEIAGPVPAGPAVEPVTPVDKPPARAPADWPDARGFIPPLPGPGTPPCRPSNAAVLRHTAFYDGSDLELTKALADYHMFRDDARAEGWQAYLQRSDDFVRFCCHEHILQMLSVRGGSGETRVVWRWPSVR